MKVLRFKFLLTIIMVIAFVSFVSADWVRVANYTTGAITNNIYICNDTSFCGLNFSSLLGLPTTIAGYGITDAYTMAQIDAQQLSQNNTFWTEISNHVNNATLNSYLLISDFDASQLVQNNTIDSKIDSVYGNLTYYPLASNPSGYINSSGANFSGYYNGSYINSTYLLISNYQSHNQNLNTTSNVTFVLLNATSGIFTGVWNMSGGADALVGSGNVRLGTDISNFAGRIGFEYKNGVTNTLWQIDNGGDSLRFFNDFAVYARINTSGIYTSQNIGADNTIYEGGLSLNAKYNDSARIDSLNSTKIDSAYGNATYLLISNFTSSSYINWSNVNNSPTNLSYFVDDLGNRGYSVLSNFSNDKNFVNGSGASNRLAVWSSNVTLGNSSIYVSSDRRVGIFDDTPDATLDVNVENASVMGLIVQGIAGQNVSLFDVRSNVPVIYIEVKANGTFYYNNSEVCTVGNGICVTNTSSLSSAISGIQSNVSAVNNSLTNEISARQSNDSALSNNITSVNSSLTTQTGRIDALNASYLLTNATVTTHTSQISGIQSNITAVNSSLSGYLLNTGDTASGNYSFDSGTLTVDSSNNRVGIGTLAPNQKLNVEGNTNITGELWVAGMNVTQNISSKLIDVTSANTYIGVSGTLNKTLTFSESVLNTTIATALATTYYNVSNITPSIGTLSGVLSDINVYDSIPYNISEVSSDLNVTMNLTVYSSNPNKIIIRYKTIVGEVDVINVQLWDYNEGLWEGYLNLGSTNGIYVIKEISIPDGTEHVSNNVSRLLFITTNTASRTDKWNFDWVSISKGVSSASGQEIDPLSVHRDGSTPLTANWDVGGYNITNVGINYSSIQNSPVFALDSRVSALNDSYVLTNNTVTTHTSQISGIQSNVSAINSSLTMQIGRIDNINTTVVNLVSQNATNVARLDEINASLISRGNWSNDKQYYYNKTESDNQNTIQNNTINTKLSINGSGNLGNVTVNGGFGGNGISLTGGSYWGDGNLFITGNLTATNINSLTYNASNLPSLNNTWNIGSTLLYWANGYFTNIYEGGSLLNTKYTLITSLNDNVTSLNTAISGRVLNATLNNYYNSSQIDNRTGYMNATDVLLSSNISAVNTSLTTQTGRIDYLNTSKANLENPTFTGTVTLPDTVYAGNNIAHTGDTDTYLSFFNANDLRLYVANNNVLWIDDSKIRFNYDKIDIDTFICSNIDCTAFYLDATNGNVGIGTTTPSQLLDVRGNVTATNFFGKLNYSYIQNSPVFALDSRVSALNDSYVLTNNTVTTHTSQISGIQTNVSSVNTSLNNEISARQSNDTALGNNISAVNTSLSNYVLTTALLSASVNQSNVWMGINSISNIYIYNNSRTLSLNETKLNMTISALMMPNITAVNNSALKNGSTVNISSLIVVNNATFDAGTLMVDTTNNRVGINTLTPNSALDVRGIVNITGNITGIQKITGSNGAMICFGAC